jgi:hypothetical protein
MTSTRAIGRTILWLCQLVPAIGGGLGRSFTAGMAPLS